MKYHFILQFFMSYHQDKAFKPYRRYGHEQYDTRGYRQQQEQPERYRINDSPYNNQSSQKSSPSFQRSPEKYYEQHQSDGPEPVWEQLYRDGLRSKKMLNQKHQNSKNKIDIQCTFQPILKKNKRYLANSNSSFLERVHIWQEHKIQKMIKEKQEQVDSDLKECTFIPKINRNFKKMQQNVTSKEQKRLDKSQNNHKKIDRNLNPYYSPTKKPTLRPQIRTQIKTPTKKSTSFIDLSDAKQMIRNQLKRIAL